MTRSTSFFALVALAIAGCGRVGYELVGDRGADGAAAAGAGTSRDGRSRDAGSGGTPGGAGGASGANAGGGGATEAGTGGTLDSGTAGNGGTGGAVDAGGGRAGSEAGARDAGPCAPTHGGVEICDGRDNDCNGTIDEAGCPTRCSGRAYGGHGYMYCVNSNLYWDACRSACVTAGMDLVVVGGAAENTFVGDWVASRHGLAWMGGTDAVTEGTWIWTDGTEFWSGSVDGGAVGGAFTSWASAEPDNGGASGPDSDCLAMGASGLWQDARCANFVDYVCEAP